MNEKTLYRKIDQKNIQCLACHHFCKIKEGEGGICRIRKNEKGKLELLTYGRPSVLNVDPIEKKPFFHFLPGSQTFSLGMLGCNFKCKNCQNYSLSQFKENSLKELVLGKEYLSPATIIKEAQSLNCPSIAYTYNEPTIESEYYLEIMALAHKNNLKNIWVSNGFFSDKVLNLIAPYLDAINIDLKSMEEEFYTKICSARLGPVLENCQKIIKNKIWLEVTTLIIPGLADGIPMLEKIARFIKEKLGAQVPWHVSAFSPEISWQLKNIPATSSAQIETAYKIGKKAGLKYVYPGNLPPSDRENTYCPYCGHLLLKRAGFSVISQTTAKKCPHCQAKVEIIFK